MKNIEIDLNKTIEEVKKIIEKAENINDIKENKDLYDVHWIDEEKELLRFDYNRCSFYIKRNLKLLNNFIEWEKDGSKIHRNISTIN